MLHAKDKKEIVLSQLIWHPISAKKQPYQDQRTHLEITERRIRKRSLWIFMIKEDGDEFTVNNIQCQTGVLTFNKIHAKFCFTS